MTVAPAPEFIDYICEYFDEKLMDPDNWTASVNDKGIDGIEIVEKKYGLWKDVVKQNNIGRVFGTDQRKVLLMSEDVEQNGIDCGCPPVYVDIETADIITGGHRHDMCARLGIPGYMFVYVKCSSEWARKRFAKALNNERMFHATLNNRDEVIEHIKFGISKNEIKCEQDIVDEVALIANNSLGKTAQTTIVKEMVSFIMLNGVTGFQPERYTTHNDTTYQDFVARSTDSYKEQVLNKHEYNHYITIENWGSRTNPLLSLAARVPVTSWINIQSSVGKPSSKESLDVKRKKVHEMLLPNLASNLDKIFIYKVTNGCYPWEHKNCQHAHLAQDCHKEDVVGGEFIRV